MSGYHGPRRTPCLICGGPGDFLKYSTKPVILNGGAPGLLCEDCKSRPPNPEPQTEWRRARQAERIDPGPPS